MENIEHKQTSTEAAGHIAGLDVGAFRASCRGKHISAAIIVLAGAVLLLGGSFIRHGDTQLFVQVVGCVVGAFGLAGWISPGQQQRLWKITLTIVCAVVGAIIALYLFRVL